MEDRRVFTRINIKLPLKFLAPAASKEIKAETIDISANGFGVVTNENLPVRTYLKMWLYIPDQHEPLCTNGEVIWCKAVIGTSQHRVGVRLEKEELMGVARTLWSQKGT